MAELLGREIRVEIDPARLRETDKQVQVADMTALRQLLGWAPSTDLREAMVRLLRFEKLC